MPRLPFLLPLLFAASALAAIEGPGVDQLIPAARATTGRLRVDGRLDEAQWASAPVFDSFVQTFPVEGARPSERTEVRVLYDDQHLYVGVTCHDSRPADIVAALGRRDNSPASDKVWVTIDPTHDHRTAYGFSVNAGGVLMDGMFFEDTQFTSSWDGIWDGAAAVLADGWSAELEIPLHLLRYPAAKNQTWGFAVRRELFRTHEALDTVFVPKSSNAGVSRWGHLTNLIDLKPERAFELTPYLAARTQVVPVSTDPALPSPRVVNPSLDVGLDLKASVSSDLNLNATVNPDFGQIEADQIILNLSSYEVYFPEKRPFFTQGLDLFLPVGAQDGRSPQTLFYSRRIGLDAPIFAAAKLTGTVGEGIELGIVDAVVNGAFAPAPPPGQDLDRRFAIHSEHPLHLGPNNELPTEPSAARNYLAAVLRKQATRTSTLGASIASSTPLAGECPVQNRPSACDEAGAVAGAMDWNLRSEDGQYVALGQLDASVLQGGPADTVLPDGTHLRPFDAGFGAYLIGGKLGGEPFRFDFLYEYASPKLELNKTGYLRTQNAQRAGGNLHLVQLHGFGPFLEVHARLGAESSWTTDGRGLNRGMGAAAEVNALLPGYHFVGLSLEYSDPKLDVRELEGTGVAFERHPRAALVVYGKTDANRAASLGGWAVVGRHLAQGPVPARTGYAFEVYGMVRPHPRFESRLTVALDFTPDGPRFRDSPDGRSFRFGSLDSRYLSVTLREQLVISPRLTLQAYAQLFSAYGRYFPLFRATSARGEPIVAGDLSEVLGPEDRYHTSALNLNVVARWEYRLGSTLYAVYSRSQEEAPTGATDAPMSLAPAALFAGPAKDLFLVKWAYWWDV
ncbi:MAG: DUF5916 domain-containing protein [Myxococcaceae bacterium]